MAGGGGGAGKRAGGAGLEDCLEHGAVEHRDRDQGAVIPKPDESGHQLPSPPANIPSRPCGPFRPSCECSDRWGCWSALRSRPGSGWRSLSRRQASRPGRRPAAAAAAGLGRTRGRASSCLTGRRRRRAGRRWPGRCVSRRLSRGWLALCLRPLPPPSVSALCLRPLPPPSASALSLRPLPSCLHFPIAACRRHLNRGLLQEGSDRYAAGQQGARAVLRCGVGVTPKELHRYVTRGSSGGVAAAAEAERELRAAERAPVVMDDGTAKSTARLPSDFGRCLFRQGIGRGREGCQQIDGTADGAGVFESRDGAEAAPGRQPDRCRLHLVGGAEPPRRPAAAGAGAAAAGAAPPWLRGAVKLPTSWPLPFPIELIDLSEGWAQSWYAVGYQKPSAADLSIVASAARCWPRSASRSRRPTSIRRPVAAGW